MSELGTLTRCSLGLLTALFVLCAELQAAGAEATSACATPVGRIVSVQGTVEVQRTGQQAWIAVKRLDTPLCQGDFIRTGPASRAALVVLPEKFVRVDQSSTLSVSVKDDETVVELVQGGAGYFITRFPRKFKVNTPFLNAAVEGTEFMVSMGADAGAVAVFEGKVSAQSGDGQRVTLQSGQTASAGAGEAPVVKLTVKPLDAVQWALYYPPLGASGPDAGPDQSCEQADAGERSRCLVVRGEQRVRVGRVDDAQADIEAALLLAPDSSSANALSSIISVVKNDNAGALALAQKATQADSGSLQAWIALSYAQQAGFKLEDALASAERAAAIDSGSAIAQTRVAELLMSLGRLRSAQRVAQAAVDANPNESRAHTILGFAYLAQVDTAKARAEFDMAIERDSSDPLPRLGLGLALIRARELNTGREQIEIAVLLDPASSLMRSYVGKAYYEENTRERDKLAGTQFGLAKQLDPKDPTPWFYDAVREDADNRPIAAVSELQRSIELNDSRAVNRSRLLLDQDRAARSASLARIYDEIGLPQLSLAEGFRALDDDPIDYSAHRFLADAYLKQPNHEIGRLSELLQSQLRQPENLQPIQPQLGETGLYIVPGAGPAQPSFNEYNRLFTRNGVRLYADGIAGANSTYGDDALVSLLTDRVSLSAGQFHYQTDGFRPNADQKRDLLTAFGQFNISAETSVQVEARTLHSDTGDLQMRFDPDNFFPNDRDKIDTDTYRLGLRHDLSADTQLIVSALTQRSHEDKDQFRNLDTAFQILPPPFFPPTPATLNNQFAGSLDQRGYLTEAQVSHRWAQAQLIVGAGWFESHNETTTVATTTTRLGAPLFTTLPPSQQTTVQDFDAHQANAYAYSHFQWPSDFSWTLGLSVNDYSSLSVDGTQVNPKFGVMWTPFSGTTVRAAAFRTLRRDLLTDQTIEPTQVAGFNQFFDDPAATDATRYGIGLDQRFARNVFGGFEITHRVLSEPLPTPLTGTTDAHEDLDRAYLYWMPSRWAALRGDYYFQRLSQPPSLVSGGFNYLYLRTERAPLGVSLFGPYGFSLAATTSWVRQKGTFLDTISGQQSDGTSTFWLTDVELRWRLPRRAGTIAVGIQNLFDRRFSYFEPDPTNPTVYPERFWYARFELAL